LGLAGCVGKAWRSKGDRRSPADAVRILAGVFDGNQGFLQRPGKQFDCRDISADADAGGLTVCRTLGKSAATQRLQQIASGIAIAADDRRDLVVSNVDEGAEHGRLERLLETPGEGAERYFAIGMVTGHQQRPRHCDRQLCTGLNAPQRAKTPQFLLGRRDAAQKFVNEMDKAARLLRNNERILGGVGVSQYVIDVVE